MNVRDYFIREILMEVRDIAQTCREKADAGADLVTGASLERDGGANATRPGSLHETAKRVPADADGGEHAVGSLLGLRNSRGLTQVAAAAAMGVTEKTWRLWEQNGPSRMGKLLLKEAGWI